MIHGRVCAVFSLEELLGDLYETIAAPRLLESVLRKFETAIGSDGCHLFAVNERGEEQMTVFTMDWVGQKDLAPYYQHYIHEDPRKAAADARPIGVVYQCSEYFPENYVSRSGFYQDFLLPLGARFIAGCTLERGATQNAYVAFNRLKGRPDFGAEEIGLMTRFLPHLRRTVRLGLDRHVMQMREAVESDLLNQQQFGAIAVNRVGRVLYVNHAGEAYLGALGTSFFKVGAVREGSDLQLAICRAVKQRLPQVLRCLNEQGEHVLTAWPATSFKSYELMPTVNPDLNVMHALVVIRTLQPGERLTHSALVQLYGLSPAEARLAKGLASGLSVDEYALKFHVSVATVRTQLRAILEKSGYARLQDLVRMLASLPAV